MGYPEITISHIDHARDAKDCAATLREFAKKAMVMLDAEFSSDDAISFGVEIFLAEDGQSAQISSPFGKGRASFAVYLGATGMYGRYTFQRFGLDHLDRDIWDEVFFFDISPDSLITSEFHGDDSSRYSVLRPYREQYFALALAITAALGRNPADQGEPVR